MKFTDEDFLEALDERSPKPTILVAQTVRCSLSAARYRLDDMSCRGLVSKRMEVGWSGRPEYQWCKA